MDENNAQPQIQAQGSLCSDSTNGEENGKNEGILD